MATVPDKVLSWLYSVLHEYRDPQRTYADAVRTLSLHPSLAPRTEVFTHEDGSSALLLTLAGTLPVAFRGVTYNFPVKIWIPRAFPAEAPTFYVTPGRDMLVRPGQHVAVDGRIYHPYLRDWARMWERASTAEFLEYLQHIFSKEPPVISRAQQDHFRDRPPQQASPGAPPPLPPPPPPKQPIGKEGPYRTTDSTEPPVLPPKPGTTPAPGEKYADTRRDVSRDGPPLPPLPHEMPRNQRVLSLSSHGYSAAPISPAPSQAAPSSGYPNGHPHAPSSYTDGPGATRQQHHAVHDGSPVSPVSPQRGVFEMPGYRYAQAAPLSPPQIQPQQLRQQSQPPVTCHRPLPQQHALPTDLQQDHRQPQQQSAPHHQLPPQQQQPVPQKLPAPDLLTDPFEVAIPGPAAQQDVPAPPIPPNPEKEQLLHAISSTLVQQAQQIVDQNLSAIAPLQAQQQAIYAAQQRLDAEIRQLEQLDQTLCKNESILRQTLQDCDRTIAAAREKPLPPIDEVLIAPTMVANQLWTLCAEEAACREAMYVLQKANDKGRVGGDVFIRQMRGLGRECFLKMALARKCAVGMGLEVNRIRR